MQAFFELFTNLQCVVPQDGAILLHKGRKNVLFSWPVFATNLPQTYQVALIDKVTVKAGAGVDIWSYVNQKEYGSRPSGGHD